MYDSVDLVRFGNSEIQLPGQPFPLETFYKSFPANFK